MKSTLVSVIIPNYNYGKYLSDSITSVLNQTYGNLEIIVVNNGSTDNSLDVLATYSQSIRLIDQPNLGQAMSRNNGAASSMGSFLAFLDADDIWESTKIEKQMALIRSGVNLIYCGVSTFSETPGYVSEILSPSHRGDRSRDFIDYPARSIVICGESSSLMTRKLFEKLEGFDKNLNSSSGWDFFRRAADLTQFDYVEEPLVRYRQHPNNMSKNVSQNIRELELAYNKIFREKTENSERIECESLIRYLELSFFKTQVKGGHLFSAIKHLLNYLLIPQKKYGINHPGG